MISLKKMQKVNLCLWPTLLVIAAMFLACGDEEAPPPPVLCVAKPSGLVSWWRGESNAQDAQALYNGAITPASTVTFAAAEVGTGFVFNGTTAPGYLNINNGTVTGTQLDVGAADFSVEFWLKTTSNLDTGVGEFIIGHAGFGQAPGFRVVYQPSNSNLIRFRIADATCVTCPTVDTTTVTNDGVWHHYAFVRNAGNILAYRDGALVGTTATAPVTSITSTAEFHIGGRTPILPATSDSALDGSLDEVSFYSRALTATEITTIFGAGVNGKCP